MVQRTIRELDPTGGPTRLSREAGELAQTALDALRFFPPLWLDSIFGHPWTWAPPHDELSELRMVDPKALARALRYLRDITIPGLARDPGGLVPDWLDPWIYRPTDIFPWPGAPPQDAFSGEAWFFINGVGTNRDVAELNAEQLVRMFGRPLTVIQNSTNSVGVDLVECALGKAWRLMTEPACVAFDPIRDALNERERVVVICHSQGTIIMSNVLRALVDAGFRRELFAVGERGARRGRRVPVTVRHRSSLAKLEIYAFANCADRMEKVEGTEEDGSRRFVPWIESFGNQFDLVARLGMLAPRAEEQGIVIDGPKWIAAGAWGHLLNEHYLLPMSRSRRSGRRGEPFQPLPGSAHDVAGSPRLFEYWGGATPEPY